MKIIYRMIGYLQRDEKILLLLGAGVMHIIKWLSLYPHNMLSFPFIIALVPAFRINQACETFYTTENYDKYAENVIRGRAFRFPTPDKFFYSTMIEDIGAKRRMAGFYYAISKILFFGTVGAIFYLGIRSNFLK